MKVCISLHPYALSYCSDILPWLEMQKRANEMHLEAKKLRAQLTLEREKYAVLQKQKLELLHKLGSFDKRFAVMAAERCAAFSAVQWAVNISEEAKATVQTLLLPDGREEEASVLAQPLISMFEEVSWQWRQVVERMNGWKTSEP